MLKEKSPLSPLRHSGFLPKKPVHIGCVTVCSSCSLTSVQILYSSGDKPRWQFLFAPLNFFRTLEPVMEEVEGKLKVFFSQGGFKQTLLPMKTFFSTTLFLAVPLELWRSTEHLLFWLIKQREWKSKYVILRETSFKNQEVVANTSSTSFSWDALSKRKLCFLEEKFSVLPQLLIAVTSWIIWNMLCQNISAAKKNVNVKSNKKRLLSISNAVVLLNCVILQSSSLDSTFLKIKHRISSFPQAKLKIGYWIT